MSSFTTPRPGFRLLFRDDSVRLWRSARVTEEVSLGAADLARRLRAFGLDRMAARARLTVLLPERTVWEAALVLPRWNPTARRRAARAAAAEALGLDPAAVAVAVGRRRPDGTTPIAAIPAARLAETRAFLAPLGLDPDCVGTTGGSVGFRRSPAFLPARLVPDLPSFAGLHLPTGFLAPLPRRAQPALLAGTGLAAVAAIGLAVLPGDQQPDRLAAAPEALEAPSMTVMPVPAYPVLSTLHAAPDPAPHHRPAGLAPITLARAEPPALRIAPAAPRPAPIARTEAIGSAPVVTMATRNLPPTPLPPLPQSARGDAGPRVAELGTTMTDAVMPRPRPVSGPVTRDVLARIGAELPAGAATSLRPRWRPLAVRAESAEADLPFGAAAAATLATDPSPRPEPRPGAATTVAAAAAGTAPRPRQGAAPIPEDVAAVAAATSAAFVSAARPAPRQAAARIVPVAVASLGPVRGLVPATAPAARTTASVGPSVRAAVATATTPAAAPRALPPQPKRVAALPPAVSVPQKPRAAASVPVTTRSLPSAPRSLAAAVPVPVRTTSARGPVVQPAPKIVAVPRIASTQPAVQKSTPRESWRARGFLSARATPTTTEKVGVSRRGASLIGVFGDADGRYALVQTQRGKVARVRQGDTVDGAVVASITKDSVALDGRNATILRLPD